jgi:hypothetical protein
MKSAGGVDHEVIKIRELLFQYTPTTWPQCARVLVHGIHHGSGFSRTWRDPRVSVAACIAIACGDFYARMLIGMASGWSRWLWLFNMAHYAPFVGALASGAVAYMVHAFCAQLGRRRRLLLPLRHAEAESQCSTSNRVRRTFVLWAFELFLLAAFAGQVGGLLATFKWLYDAAFGPAFWWSLLLLQAPSMLLCASVTALLQCVQEYRLFPLDDVELNAAMAAVQRDFAVSSDDDDDEQQHIVQQSV